MTLRDLERSFRYIENIIGCHFKSACVSVFLHADDILLIAPSVNALRTLLNCPVFFSKSPIFDLFSLVAPQP